MNRQKDRSSALNPWLGLTGALLIQLCLGATYAWSTFVKNLQTECAVDPVTSQWVFAVRTAAFALFMIPMGQWLPRFGLRAVAGTCGLLFALGHMLPFLLPPSPAVLISTMGLMIGLGMSGGYLAALRVCATVIPERKGLMIGLAVAAFAMGAVAASHLGMALLANQWPVLSGFALLGAIYGAVLLGSALLLPGPAAPPSTTTPSAQPASAQTSELSRELKSTARTCFLAKLATNFGGLMVIGNMVPIATTLGHTPEVGITGIAAFSFGNAIGRIFWGGWFDRSGPLTIVWSLAAMAVSLIGLAAFGVAPFLFPVFTFGVGFCFGAAFVLHASLLTQIFGPAVLQHTYPWVFTAHGLAAILGAPTGAWLIALSGGITAPLAIAAGASLLGMIAFWHRLRSNSSFGAPAQPSLLPPAPRLQPASN
ncbi:MAG: Oxalate/formate antiporter [Candidatus Ozemobacter sibiricus]|jgi:OFA family oxalate/formate antiporter-like MFS transporter|uniref:Oxalate/formate antiporter n=1 Tax=Candidatus Ozemobacter sibiricus TaxID=2268124 RepID=A0A367ZL42_9BACT|nr:MAG: Oxalate/formate antiporter [Candidatus Ozemobacter sibiricus]